MQRVYRLSNNASFNYIYKKGTGVGSKLFAIHYVSASSIKVGISVSKKIGNSVVRSLVKRRIKESFRLLIPRLTVKCNYVIVARQGIEAATYQEINNSLIILLTRIKHLC